MIDRRQLKQELVDSLLHFTRIFYLIRTGRKFELSNPPGRESHYITICNALEKVFDGKCKRLIINVPPRYGKTELVIHFVAWAMAQYPDSNFLYVSYSHALAKKQTQTIRSILLMREYQDYFGVKLKEDTSAKDNFETIQGGSVYAAGAGGSITGRGAGIKGVNRFGGFIAIDDIHKPDEVSSDTIREGINNWYYNTLQSRLNSPQTPIVFIGQRLHEDDLAATLIKSGEWETVIIPAIDVAGNPLHEEMHDLPTLKKMQEISPYTFAAQYQQDPQPAGGGIFKPEWFLLFDEEPDIIATFITADSAETEKEYNDATVFSFWGLYKIKEDGLTTDKYALHWLDCVELRVEPKDLQPHFSSFYASCLRYKEKPTVVAIEKKSTGVTLLSTLKDYQGLRTHEITRDRTSGSKIERFLEAQPYVAQKLITLPRYGKHTHMCIEHCRKITANNSHRFDDICFVAGTQIATLFGYKNIENIKINDFIITPFGICKVLNSGLTGYSEIIKNKGLTGTKGHPVFYGDRYERLDSIYDDVKISKLSFKELLRWKYRKLLYLMESNIDLWAREDIILANQKIIKNESMLKDCMWRFMNFIVEKKYLKAILFIIKIIIISIIIMTTWNVFRVSNIYRCMLKKGKDVYRHLKNSLTWKRLESKQKYGMQVKREEHGIEKMPKQVLIKLENLIVGFVERLLKQKLLRPKYAVNYVEEGSADHCSKNLPLTACYAENNLQQKKVYQEAGIEKPVLPIAQDKDIKAVYNLTVNKMHVYYANNILVSNCDTMYDAINLGLITKTIVNMAKKKDNDAPIAKNFMSTFNKVDRLKKDAYS
jgi:hypothetical protein